MKDKNRRWIAAGTVMFTAGKLGSQDVNQAMTNEYGETNQESENDIAIQTHKSKDRVRANAGIGTGRRESRPDRLQLALTSAHF